VNLYHQALTTSQADSCVRAAKAAGVISISFGSTARGTGRDAIYFLIQAGRNPKRISPMAFGPGCAAGARYDGAMSGAAGGQFPRNLRAHKSDDAATRPQEWGRGTLRACATGSLETDCLEDAALCPVYLPRAVELRRGLRSRGIGHVGSSNGLRCNRRIRRGGRV
jgi:hypothetical protein